MRLNEELSDIKALRERNILEISLPQQLNIQGVVFEALTTELPSLLRPKCLKLEDKRKKHTKTNS